MSSRTIIHANKCSSYLLRLLFVVNGLQRKKRIHPVQVMKTFVFVRRER